MGFDVDIKGLKDLNLFFYTLADNVSNKYANRAAAAAARIARDALKQEPTPRWSGRVSEGHAPAGTLRKAPIVARDKGVSDGVRKYWVGFKQGKKYQSVGKKQSNQDAYYARWVIRGSKHNPEPKPLVDDVLKKHGQEMIDAMVKSLNESIEKGN